jgi:glycosyltransferase involved in cell wall biosynthesis
VRELSRALAADGHEVTVLTRRDSADLPETVPLCPGVTVRHVTAGPPTAIPKDELVQHVPALADELRRLWAADPPDVVHAHFWMSGLAATAAVRAGDVPLVQTFHALGHVKQRHQGHEDTSPRGRITAEQVVARRSDRVIATCEDELLELTRMGTPRQRISVVPCGVDVDLFTPQGPALPRTERPRLVTIGRLVRRKGVDEVIEALARVPAAELLVAGGPPAGQDPAADPDLRRLREVAERAGVASRVRFLGAMAQQDVPALLRSADVVVCAPWYEPFGMVPLEAMACSRAVVASEVGGMIDSVVDRITGVHVPPRRPDELGRVLRRLLADTGLSAAYGMAGRDRAVSRYAWPRVAVATAAVYRDVLDGRAARTETRCAAYRPIATAGSR